MGADFWTILGAVGSAVGGFATIAAAGLAGRIAWLTAYGARPWISAFMFGREALNPEKTINAQTLGLTITNRQKVPVRIYRIDVCVPGEVFTGEIRDPKLRLNGENFGSFLVIASQAKGDVMQLRIKQEIAPGLSYGFEFHALVEGRGAGVGSARYMAFMQRDEPHVASFWIERVFDFKGLDNGFRRKPPRSLRWTIAKMRDWLSHSHRWK
ncbi:hypothetical protein [Aureimonas sp. AU40]|uniref:hypothetical protein n=1 Tax=Aureimonas sp. AU40 TaxID=1637747 RepID=UPI0012E36F26|nr:hypothetical protein [Aureimonas sp. AU40]